jgi:hypothetical protein
MEDDQAQIEISDIWQTVAEHSTTNGPLFQDIMRAMGGLFVGERSPQICLVSERRHLPVANKSKLVLVNRGTGCLCIESAGLLGGPGHVIIPAGPPRHGVFVVMLPDDRQFGSVIVWSDTEATIEYDAA